MQPCIDNVHRQESCLVLMERNAQLLPDLFQAVSSECKLLREIIVNGIHQRIGKCHAFFLPLNGKADMIWHTDNQRLFQHFLVQLLCNVVYQVGSQSDVFIRDLRKTLHHPFPQCRIGNQINLLHLRRVDLVPTLFSESDAFSGSDLFSAFFIQYANGIVVDNFYNFHKAPRKWYKKSQPLYRYHFACIKVGYAQSDKIVER